MFNYQEQRHRHRVMFFNMDPDCTSWLLTSHKLNSTITEKDNWSEGGLAGDSRLLS